MTRSLPGTHWNRISSACFGSHTHTPTVKYVLYPIQSFIPIYKDSSFFPQTHTYIPFQLFTQTVSFCICVCSRWLSAIFYKELYGAISVLTWSTTQVDSILLPIMNKQQALLLFYLAFNLKQLHYYVNLYSLLDTTKLFSRIIEKKNWFSAKSKWGLFVRKKHYHYTTKLHIYHWHNLLIN